MAILSSVAIRYLCYTPAPSELPNPKPFFYIGHKNYVKSETEGTYSHCNEENYDRTWTELFNLDKCIAHGFGNWK